MTWTCALCPSHGPRFKNSALCAACRASLLAAGLRLQRIEMMLPEVQEARK